MQDPILAIKNFMAFVGLQWKPGTTQKAELKCTYRIGNTRPLTIDCTVVEFYCDEKRPKVSVPEFTRTSFHEWFEVPRQSFDYTPGGTMLKIRNEARGNQAAYSVGIKPVA